MKIVVDDKIPYILPALNALADNVVALPGSSITADDVHDADILVVRTRTRCNRQLLEGSNVRLVLTATIGYDHIDTAYMREAGIEWHNCPGCNASSVGQYIHSCLILLQQERNIRLADTTVGIIGMGHVGKAVLRWLQDLGLRRILLNDPPQAEAGASAPEGYEWSTLEQIQSEADIITLHVPLTTNGSHPTRHLISTSFIQGMQRPFTIINAARGGVVDEAALLAAIDDGKVQTAIIDTWEGEPQLNLTLLNKVFIGTPHIAGYSADGKANASRMCVETICRFLGRPMTFTIEPPALPADSHITAQSDTQALALALYDPRRDSLALKSAPSTFEQLRGNYPLRREHTT